MQTAHHLRTFFFQHETPLLDEIRRHQAEELLKRVIELHPDIGQEGTYSDKWTNPRSLSATIAHFIKSAGYVMASPGEPLPSTENGSDAGNTDAGQATPSPEFLLLQNQLSAQATQIERLTSTLERVLEQLLTHRASSGSTEEMPRQFTPPQAHPQPGPHMQTPRRFRTDEIGYFDPELDESFGTGEVVQVGKDIYYRNPRTFMSRAKSIADLVGPQLIQQNLELCLRGSAMRWHVHELSSIEKAMLRSSNTLATPGYHQLDAWQDALIRRFQRSVTSAMRLIQTTHYTIKDLQSHHSITQYVANMLYYTEDAGITLVHQRLLHAWMNIEARLKQHIPKPTSTTTVTDFQRQLQDQQDLWEALYLEHPYNNQDDDYHQRSQSPPARQSKSGRAIDAPAPLKQITAHHAHCSEDDSD